MLPVLSLRGLSTGDFAPALRDLLGEDASGLSASSISRLTEQWQTDHAAFDEDDEDRPSTGLDLLCRSLVARAIWVAALALIAAAVVLGVFAWDPSAVAAGTAAGVVIWGALEYFTAIRPRLPTGALETAPADAAWERSTAWGLMRLAPRLLLAVPLCLGLAWFADRTDLGNVFVPGQFAGYAAASLLVLLDLDLQRRGDHPASALTGELVARDRDLFVSREGEPANILHGVPSCRPTPASVFINREGTPPSFSSPSTTSGYISHSAARRIRAARRTTPCQGSATPGLS